MGLFEKNIYSSFLYKKNIIIHIWFESNLVNFEFPDGLNTVLGSSQPAYLKIGVEFTLTKNVPFSKISVKI